MNAQLRMQIRQRAGDRCEYCQMPQHATVLPHEVDHIRSQKHGGPSIAENLCWACALCNSFKGTDVASFVPGSSEIVRLFNPRIDPWDEHFHWQDHILHGKSAIGAVTIALLRINQSDRVEHRRLLMQAGAWK
jgi:hypothetical protein